MQIICALISRGAQSAMTDEPENHTLALLREMRAEMREGFEKAFGDLAELRDSVSELQREVAAMRVDQGRTNELLEQVHKAQQNHGARLNASLNAIDGRLALIEHHVGLVQT
jgi:chromosome segregation ATPase